MSYLDNLPTDVCSISQTEYAATSESNNSFFSMLDYQV